MTGLENAYNKEKHRLAGVRFNAEMKEPVIVLEGLEYSYKEFDEAFPIDHIDVAPKNLKGQNSDGTKSWMKS